MNGNSGIDAKGLRAIIFDLDDTLVLSTIDFSKFKRNVIKKIGSWGEDETLYSPDETIVVILTRFEKRCRDAGMPEEMLRSRLRELDRIMDEVELEKVEETKAIQGAAALLEMLRRKAIKVGILTRGCDEYASKAMSVAGIRDLVDAVECRNPNTKAKPDPEAYFKLTASLAVLPQDTMFVGDHPIDAQCAKNARVPFVAVMTGDVPEERLRDAGSIEVFRDVGELREWLERILA